MSYFRRLFRTTVSRLRMMPYSRTTSSTVQMNGCSRMFVCAGIVLRANEGFIDDAHFQARRNEYYMVDFNNILTEGLKSVINLCGNDVDDPANVYKICQDDSGQSFLIIMKKLPDTITDESRQDIVDPNYAEYNANVLTVVKIVNLDSTKSDVTSICHNSICYTVDKLTTSTQLTTPLTDVMANSIHIQYYKTLRTVYYLQKTAPKNIDDVRYICAKNGEKEEVLEYKNGCILSKVRLYVNEWGSKQNSYICHKYNENGWRTDEFVLDTHGNLTILY